MTRRDFIIKWLLYVLALLPVFILNQYILPWFPIFGIVPTLLPVASVTLAVLEGPAGGAGFGLFVGILADALIPGLPGWSTLLFPLLGLGAGAAARYGIHQNYPGCLICSTGALILIGLGRVIYYLLCAYGSVWELLGVAVPEILLSLVFTPLIYGIFLWVHRRVPQASSVL